MSNCKHKFTEWKHWKNEYPRMFQSLENEIKECKKCGIIIFKYKPEGSMNREHWKKEDIVYMDILHKELFGDE